MPNRIIKESICTSESLEKLSWFEQVLFFRLIVLADDYGCYDGRTAIIKGHGFPLSSVTEKQIADGLSKLGTAGIVNLYTVGGRPYLQLESWSKHQRIRNLKHKYPLPEDCDNSPQIAASRGLNPIRIQSESESKSENNIARQAEQIVSFLNEKAGTTYKPTLKSTQRLISARLNDGFTVQDFYTVIEKQCRQWLKNPKMAQYLRPQTLFGTKFEGYLNSPEGGENGNAGERFSDGPSWGTTV